MGGVGDAAAGSAHRRQQRDRADDHHEVLRRNREDEVQQDRPMRKIAGVGEQDPVHRARGADGQRVVQLIRERERQERAQHRRQCRADAGDEIELHEEPAAPHPFQLHAEHPQREHVEKDVEDPAMQKHVGDGLPEGKIFDDVRRPQAQPQRDGRHDQREQERADVGGNQHLDGRRQRTRSKRRGER